MNGLLRKLTGLLLSLGCGLASASTVRFLLDEEHATESPTIISSHDPRGLTDLVHARCEARLAETGRPPFEETVEQMRKDYRSNLGIRGLATTFDAPTPENGNGAKAEKYGFKWWYTQGYFVKRGKTEQESINNAIEHSRMFSHAVQDRFSVGLYFIADEAELGVDHSAEGNVVPMANLHKILSQGAIEIDYFSESGQALKDPRVRKISGKELLERINILNQENPKAAVRYVTGHDRVYGANHINIFGWHTGKFRGIIDHMAFLNSALFRELMSIYQTLYMRGYRAIFRPMEAIRDAALEVLLRTQRKKSMKDENGQRVDKLLPLSINRHNNPGVGTDHLKGDASWVATLLSPFENLVNLSATDTEQILKKYPNSYIEVLQFMKSVIGGEAGRIKNLEGETIFYQDDEFNDPFVKNPILASQIAMCVEILLAVERGQLFSSSGAMVSNYSEYMGTKVVPLDEALEIMANQPQGVLVYPTNYVLNPFKSSPLIERVLEDNFGKKFTDMVRKAQGSQGGLTKQLFLGAAPAVNEDTVARAAKFGLEPAKLRVQIVHSLEEAHQIKEQQEWDKGYNVSGTLFVVIPLTNGIKMSSFEASLTNSTAEEALRKLFQKGNLPTPEQQKEYRLLNFAGGSDHPHDVKLIFSYKKEGKKELRHYDEGELLTRIIGSDDGFIGAEWRPGYAITVDGWVLKGSKQ